MRSEKSIRKEIVDFGKLLYDRRLTFGTAGNISARAGEDRMLITPSGKCKGLLQESDPILMSISSGKVVGRGKPSIETPFHLAFYRSREEVGAVIHSHPLSCTVLAVAGVPVKTGLTPEGVLVLGDVPLVKYETPGTERLARRLTESAVGARACLLEKHGAIAVGKDLEEAFYRIETLEFLASLQVGLAPFPGIKELPKGERKRIESTG
ncbi:MAG: class II aldolase/adducin family protein [Euryarchaeota archaeon]|nr:class II aldolase/adducin family protein [Euryarchaeota archaeon]